MIDVDKVNEIAQLEKVIAKLGFSSSVCPKFV